MVLSQNGPFFVTSIILLYWVQRWLCQHLSCWVTFKTRKKTWVIEVIWWLLQKPTWIIYLPVVGFWPSIPTLSLPSLMVTVPMLSIVVLHDKGHVWGTAMTCKPLPGAVEVLCFVLHGLPVDHCAAMLVNLFISTCWSSNRGTWHWGGIVTTLGVDYCSWICWCCSVCSGSCTCCVSWVYCRSDGCRSCCLLDLSLLLVASWNVLAQKLTSLASNCVKLNYMSYYKLNSSSYLAFILLYTLTLGRASFNTFCIDITKQFFECIV